MRSESIYEFGDGHGANRRLTIVSGVVIGVALSVALVLSACGGSGGAKPANAGADQLSATGTPTSAAASPTISPTAGTIAAATPPAAATSTPTAGSASAASSGGSDRAAAKRAAVANLQLSADTVAKSLQRHELPLSQPQMVTSQTDPDHKLGQAGQYSSRVDFVDTTLGSQAGDWSLANGGAIEVFDSVQDATKTMKQLSGGSKLGSAPGEVDYQTGKVLLRLSPRLPQAQIANYETATRDTMVAAVKVEEGRKGNKHAPAATATPTASPRPQ